MSKISDIYDAWITLIETSLPGYARIPNAFEMDKAPSITLRKGYAFRPATGTNTERLIGCLRSYQRTFDIAIVNQITCTENNVESWNNLIKGIHEDLATLFHDIEKSSTLNDVTNGLGTSKLTADGGIDFVELQNNKYFLIVGAAETEYFEQL